jgi:nitrite reductase/ring-hydroxylating ferredoxin subunit
MPDLESPAQPLCASTELAERGRGHLFEVRLWGQSARAFALRFDGRVVAYVNRCAHVPAEMDWQPGEFLDDTRRWILCSIHGAAYEPSNGVCVAGPCRGKRLIPILIEESDDQVRWYPDRHVQPAAPVAGPPPSTPDASP